MREAFRTYADEETTPVIEMVIARWYDNSEPYDLHRINDSPAEANIDDIDGRIDNLYVSYGRGGAPTSEITIGTDRNTAPNLNLEYSYRNPEGLDTLPIEVAFSFEDGFEFPLRHDTAFERLRIEVPLPEGRATNKHSFWFKEPEALGRYLVQVYWGKQKVAETTFETVPAPDLYTISGYVNFPGGPSPGRRSVRLLKGEERFSVDAGRGGYFGVNVSSSTYAMTFSVQKGNTWHFVGWYDGESGIMNDSS